MIGNRNKPSQRTAFFGVDAAFAIKLKEAADRVVGKSSSVMQGRQYSFTLFGRDLHGRWCLYYVIPKPAGANPVKKVPNNQKGDYAVHWEGAKQS